VPHELEALVMRCLAKRPEERFANMQELIDALRAIGRTIGAEEGMHNPMSILPPSMTTSTGNTPSPAQQPSRSNRPGASGNAGNPRTSEPVRLRLDNFEATPSGTQVRKAPVKRSLILPIAIATACGVIGALLVWLLVGPGQSATSQANAGGVTATPLPAPPEPSVAPIVEEPPAAEAAQEEPPVMDFTDQALDAPRKPAPDTTQAATPARAELPSVMITARSVPPGAAVLVRGTRMGLSPVTFRFQDAQAKQGQAIAVTFQLKGYTSKTVRQPIAGEELIVDAVLVADQPAEAAPVENEEPAQDEGAAEDALLEIEKRARKLEAPAADSVLKITETPAEE
jgi:serine/threonine-protein kinase